MSSKDNARDISKDWNFCVLSPFEKKNPFKRVNYLDFSYETSDGVTRQEQAEVKNAGTDQEALSVRGSVSWVAPDGQTYTLHYIADENGFQPQGDHLPHN